MPFKPAVISRMQAVEADITGLDVDAIVNAANERLAPGGGVCGAIHRAAGPDLAQACAQIGFCPTGDARLTPGFGLAARHVIHAVGPVWRGGAQGEDDLLAGAYRSSLDLAVKNDLETIAFPAISTGIYGFPADRAAGIAARTVAEFLASRPSIRMVTFCCFGAESLALHQEALRELG